MNHSVHIAKPGRCLAVLLLTAAALLYPSLPRAASRPLRLFGFNEVGQQDVDYLPQWVSALERHIREDVPEGDCSDTAFNRCHLREWFAFLEGLRGLPVEQQIREVNRYANTKKYVLDLYNYAAEDYWAIAREFLYNGGDCEDYAITKFFSLRWLGVDQDRLRIVVLQDTNLRVPHAVLAVYTGKDILILDNQVQEVLSHRQIVHYVPLYSVNERMWWLHYPKL